MPARWLSPILVHMTENQATTNSKIHRLAARVAAVVAGGTMIGAGLAVGSAGVASAASTGQATFYPAGAAIQYWTVPPGVTTAQFAVSGAQGGSFLGTTTPSIGGKGGAVIASVPVVPGTTYSLVVGLAGTSVSQRSDGHTTPGGGGGYGGGGNGAQCSMLEGVCSSGAGGGGESGVYLGSTTVVVAGGGGGATWGATGGAGGGLTGGQGESTIGGPAGGATQIGGGTAGFDA